MNIIQGSAAAPTMTSLQMVEFINDHRAELAQKAGQSFPSLGFAELRHRDFMAKAPEVLGAGVCEKFRAPYVNSQNQQEYSMFVFPKREACLMAMSYSYELQAKVFDRMTALEVAARDPLAHLPAEQRALVQVMLDNADLKRQQAIHTQAIAQIESRVEEVADTQLLTSRPQNSESITHLRPRCAKAFGLPERVVEYVIRQSPYAPKPAGMVKNDDERALGSTYSVWWTKDVNDVLRRFVKECVMVTPAFAEHPYVDGRFKLMRKEAA